MKEFDDRNEIRKKIESEENQPRRNRFRFLILAVACTSAVLLVPPRLHPTDWSDLRHAAALRARADVMTWGASPFLGTAVRILDVRLSEEKGLLAPVRFAPIPLPAAYDTRPAFN